MMCPHCGGDVDCQDLEARRSLGIPVGRAPYGWRNVGRDLQMEPDPEEQKILTLMLALRKTGETLNVIAATLNANDYRTRSGTPWIRQYVHNILKGQASI